MGETVAASCRDRAMQIGWLIPLVPLGVHVAILVDRPALAVSVIASYLVVLAVGLAPLRWRLPAVSLVVLACAILWGLSVGQWLLFALPMVMYGALLHVFAASLRSGSDPVATRFARVLHPEPTLPPRVLRYTRRVTWFWVAHFALMLLTSLLLAAFAPLDVWSWFANLGGYLITAALFALEYGVRRWCFRDMPQPSLTDCFHRLSRCNLRALLRR